MGSILLTGGAGYIGSHIAVQLREAGEECVMLDDLSKGCLEAVKGFQVVVGDIGDTKLVGETIEKHSVDEVIHLAGVTTVPEGVANPLRCYEVNVERSVAFLRSCVKSGVKRFIFSSSAAVYGEPESTPLTEEHPARPISPYGRSKLVFEWILEDVSKKAELRSLSLRYFNAAGVDGRVGDYRKGRTHLLPIVLETALGKREVVDVFGTDYPTRDRTAIRDYCNVVDIATAHIVALRFLRQSDPPLPALNIGSGNGATVMEVIESARRITGRKIPVRAAGRRPGDPCSLVADISQAKEILGWQPQHSSLEDIISSAWEWECRRASS